MLGCSRKNPETFRFDVDYRQPACQVWLMFFSPHTHQTMHPQAHELHSSPTLAAPFPRWAHLTPPRQPHLPKGNDRIRPNVVHWLMVPCRTLQHVQLATTTAIIPEPLVLLHFTPGAGTVHGEMNGVCHTTMSFWWETMEEAASTTQGGKRRAIWGPSTGPPSLPPPGPCPPTPRFIMASGGGKKGKWCQMSGNQKDGKLTTPSSHPIPPVPLPNGSAG